METLAQGGYFNSLIAYKTNNLPPQENKTASPLRAAAWHAVREIGFNVTSKTLALATFSGIISLAQAEVPVRVVTSVVGGISGASQAFLIARQQIGSQTLAKKAAIALCTVVGGGAGVAIAASGSWTAVASAGASVAITSLVAVCGKQICSSERTQFAKTCAMSLTTVCGAAATVAGCFLHWSVMDETFVSNMVCRNLAAIVESLVIESCKYIFGQYGAFVDPRQLSFTGRMKAFAWGTIPYSVAAVAINGVLVNIPEILPHPQSTQFNDLILPVLITTLTQAVRGAANALLLYRYHHSHPKQTAEGTSRGAIRPHHGLRLPHIRSVTLKAAIRYFLITCRNALYLELRNAGYSALLASVIAYSIYSVFAQQRDLIYDLMKEGIQDIKQQHEQHDTTTTLPSTFASNMQTVSDTSGGNSTEGDSNSTAANLMPKKASQKKRIHNASTKPLHEEEADSVVVEISKTVSDSSDSDTADYYSTTTKREDVSIIV